MQGSFSATLLVFLKGLIKIELACIVPSAQIVVEGIFPILQLRVSVGEIF
jgi:hypothetical protein